MRHVNVYDQFHGLVTRLTAADGTLAAVRSHEMLDAALAREVLQAIVGGQRADSPYEPGALSDPERGHVPGY